MISKKTLGLFEDRDLQSNKLPALQDFLRQWHDELDRAHKRIFEDLSRLASGTAQGQLAFWDAEKEQWVPLEEIFWDDTAKTLRIGDATDNLTVEADGTIVFNGTATVWNDVNIGAGTLSGPPGLQPGIVNFVDENGADTGIATFGLAVGEGLSGSLEIPHSYKEGSDIFFHVHWQGIAAPTGTDNVKFQLTYTVGQFETTLNAATVITLETAFDTQYESKRSDFAAITGINFDMGNQFLFTLERVVADGDAYGGEALLGTIGVHFEEDTVGSRQIATK